MNNNYPLLINCLQLLNNMFDDKNCIFSFSTRFENDIYVNDFNNILSLRYTINTYLGIMKYNKTNDLQLFYDEFDNFLNKYFYKIKNIGDRGLLLYTLSLIDHDKTKILLNEIKNYDTKKIKNCSLQDICWLLLGVVKCYEFTKDEITVILSKKIFKILINDYFVKDSLFPIHSKNLRSRFVSFGGIVYFLKVIFEYAKIYNDNYALILFKELTERIISLQSKDGAWGWFYDNKKGLVVDWFQIYSVHQDSMSLLFLKPAIELGIERAKYAATKSLNWLFGDNIYSIRLINFTPFFIYRSIKRKYLINERLERIIRSYKNSVLDKNDILPKINKVVINKECRSYHIGWLLYVWSDFNEFIEFKNLQRN